MDEYKAYVKVIIIVQLKETKNYDNKSSRSRCISTVINRVDTCMCCIGILILSDTNYYVIFIDVC